MLHVDLALEAKEREKPNSPASKSRRRRQGAQEFMTRRATCPNIHRVKRSNRPSRSIDEIRNQLSTHFHTITGGFHVLRLSSHKTVAAVEFVPFKGNKRLLQPACTGGLTLKFPACSRRSSKEDLSGCPIHGPPPTTTRFLSLQYQHQRRTPTTWWKGADASRGLAQSNEDGGADW